MINSPPAHPYLERLVAEHALENAEPPFLTLAIPHYKHRRYLQHALESMFEQEFEDFEIVVSDDNSPDDSNQVLPQVLEASGHAFRYYAQPQNLGYDGNVRFCLSVARGRYVLLLGNDDALASRSTLARIAACLRELNYPHVAFTNYEDWAEPGSVVRRAVATRLLGDGPEAAFKYFRSFSFVSGLIYERESALRHETSRWDRSIYYQIYLACRILAAGGTLAALDVSAIRKDIHVDGQGVPNYASKWAGAKWSFQPRHTGLDSVIRVTADAVLPYLAKRERSAGLLRIIRQVLVTAYPHWLAEYRQVANWSFSVGVARDLWPGRRLAEYPLRYRHRRRLWLVYLGVTAAGLLLPVGWLQGIGRYLAQALRGRAQR